MICPKCGNTTRVLDSRKYDDTKLRKRYCCRCNSKFITREVCDEEAKKMYREYLCISKMGYRDRKKEESIK